MKAKLYFEEHRNDPREASSSRFNSHPASKEFATAGGPKEKQGQDLTSDFQRGYSLVSDEEHPSGKQIPVSVTFL